MSDGRHIVENPDTGGRKESRLARFDLLPWAELWEVAELYGRAGHKYSERNWELGYHWSLSFGALQRHAAQFWMGESKDSETGSHHLAAVIFHALALMHFEKHFPQMDNRPKPGGDG